MLYFNIENYSFFLSKKFFSPILMSNYGIASTFSGRDDYPGYIKNRLPLALIARYCDNKIYRINTDYGVSLYDCYKDKKILIIKRKIFLYRKIIITRLKSFVKKTKTSKNISILNTINSNRDFINNEALLSSYLKDQIKLIDSVEDALKELSNIFN